jgi:proteic killer suppression protein
MKAILDDDTVARYYAVVILSFKDKDTQCVFQRLSARRLPSDIHRAALRRLAYLHSAKTLKDLEMPPSNKLEGLSGDRLGQFSIRINNQWRICFKWTGNDAEFVEIVDYH